MTEVFESEGFEVCRSVLSADEIADLSSEVDRIAAVEKKVCVRGLAAKSACISELAESNMLKQLLPTDYLLVRSILFDKTAEENWPVAWHQDLSIAVLEKKEVDGYGRWSLKNEQVHVQPPESVLQQVMTLRVHLDPTPESNGALRVIRGTHRKGKLSSAEVQQLGATAEQVVCVCEAGDILKMSPLIMHASSRSTRPSRRRILHFEYAHRDSLHPELSWCR